MPRGDPSCIPTPSGKTYECRDTPVHLTIQSYNYLTCALDESKFDRGNHIKYHVGIDIPKNSLFLDYVEGNACKPKPEKCHCRTMLDRVLELNPDIERIDGHFCAKPFMKGCRCYLGAAAQVGFNSIDSEKKGCDAEFTSSNYVEVCKKLEKKKCSGAAVLLKT